MSEEQTTPTAEVDIVAPLDGDGRPYDFEMIFDGGNDRAYAHAIDDLMDSLVPGYDGLDVAGQWNARLHTAALAQVNLQAYLNNTNPLDECSIDARRILNGGRHEQPSVATWAQPVPLVLLAHAYEPAGRIPRPQSVDGTPPNVVWIDPSDEETLLVSLHAAGYLVINERSGDAPDAMS